MGNFKLSGLRMWKHKLKKPVIFVVGPTASGKTDLAIQIARHLKSEIISADSKYFYKGMNIGTAKPSANNLSEIVHHMIDIAEPDEPVSVAVYKNEVEKIIDTLHTQEKIPIVVGGTGQYIHAILHNWKMPAIEPDLRLRKVMEDYADYHGKRKLYDFLAKVDPQGAKLIDYRNVRRTIRAIEVVLKTGHRFSKQRLQEQSPYSRKIIGLHWQREELYSRIDQRIAEMIAQGLISEVITLLSKGYSIEMPAMSAIGYREIAHFVLGETSLQEAIVLMKRNSRQYVRRQANWFKVNDPDIRWFDGKVINLEDILLYLDSDDGWIRSEE